MSGHSSRVEEEEGVGGREEGEGGKKRMKREWKTAARSDLGAAWEDILQRKKMSPKKQN